MSSHIPKPLATEEGIALSYFEHNGSPHQLRIQIGRTDPTTFDNHTAHLNSEGIASVWRYNETSTAYDIRVSQDEPISTGNFVLVGGNGKLYFPGGQGASTSRLSGITDRPLRLAMSYYPRKMTQLSDEVSITVAVKASVGENDGSAIYSEAQAEHSWKVVRDSEADNSMRFVP